MKKIEHYFGKNFHIFNREDIYFLNEQDNGPINNVITNLKEHCYGVHIYDDKDQIEYLIFYIDNKFRLEGVGLLLSLKLNLKTRTIYTIEFSKIVNEKYPHADVVDTFNTIQTIARSTFEKMGFFTIGNEIKKVIGKENAVGMINTTKGVVSFPTMEKLELYRWFFNEREDFVNVDKSKNKKVYLLLDSLNNLIKIGQSFNPSIREKTLQGISPNWDLITTWIAPVSEETKLKKMFKHKNTRGEWFTLDFSDLKIIKNYMQKYKLK